MPAAGRTTLRRLMTWLRCTAGAQAEAPANPHAATERAPSAKSPVHSNVIGVQD